MNLHGFGLKSGYIGIGGGVMFKKAIKQSAASLAIIGLLMSAMPVDASWLGSRGIGIGGVGHSLKKNLGDATSALDDLTSAVISDDREKFSKAQDVFKNLPKNLIVDAFPALKTADSIGTATRNRLTTAKNRINRFVGSAGKTSVDARAALAIDKDDRNWYESRAKIMNSKPLLAAGNTGFVNPSLKLSEPASKSSVSGSFENWVKSEQKAHSNCYGAIDDATAAQCESQKSSGWSSAATDVKSESLSNSGQKQGKTSSWASGDWKTGENNAQDERLSDWDIMLKRQETRQKKSSESFNEYEKALAASLGLDDHVAIPTGNGDYQATLDDLEAEELARREAERRRIEEEREAERRRIAKKQEAKAARKAEQRRQRELERQEEERQREFERRDAEIVRENQRQALENLTQSLYNFSQSINQQTLNQMQVYEEQQRQQRARQEEANRRAEEQYRREIERQEDARIAAIERQKALEEEAARHAEEAARQAEEERRREAERREADRKAEIKWQKELRERQCRSRLGQSLTRCVQVKGRDDGKSLSGGSYYFRNTCNVKISVWYDYETPLSSLLDIQPGQTRPTAPVFYDHDSGWKRIKYAACHDKPGVHLDEKTSRICEVSDYACVE